MNKYTIYGIYQLEDIVNNRVCGRRGAIYFAEINTIVIADSEESCMEYLKKYLAKMVAMRFSMRYDPIEYDFQELTYKFTSIEPVHDTVGGVIKLSVVYEDDGRHINLRLITGDTKTYDMFHDVYIAYREYESIVDDDTLARAHAELDIDGVECKPYDE